MKNAAAPITGGVNMSPVDAAASTAPANSARYPAFFINGIVNAPAVTTFAVGLLPIMPIMAELAIAT